MLLDNELLLKSGRFDGDESGFERRARSTRAQRFFRAGMDGRRETFFISLQGFASGGEARLIRRLLLAEEEAHQVLAACLVTFA